jgi:hypothetical protein
MVAVAVLVVVVLATGKIFGTASKVTSLSEATADLMQEVPAIERRLRADLDKIAPGGVLVIKSHAVRNDYNGAVLLNPLLPPDAYIRSDQLVFFTAGLASPQDVGLDQGAGGKAQGTAARVYWGHSFQLPLASPADVSADEDCIVAAAHDPVDYLPPWHAGNAAMQRTTYCKPLGCCEMFTTSAGGTIDATQPEARRWILARQAILLADDDYGAWNAER